jgi:hypothetical protein
MKTITELQNLLTNRVTESAHSESSDLMTEQTFQTCYRLANNGYQILIGNAPHLDESAKYSGKNVIRVSKVNSRYHGNTIRTIWAVC